MGSLHRYILDKTLNSISRVLRLFKRVIRIPTIDDYQRKLFLQSVIFFVLLGTSYDRINFLRVKDVLRNTRKLL